MTEDIKAIWGGIVLLFVAGIFCLEWVGVFSALAFFAAGTVSVLCYAGMVPFEAVCWSGVAVGFGLAVDLLRFGAKMNHDIRTRDQYDRLQAIEEAWWVRNPDPQMQLRAWLKREHGLDDLDILCPMATSDGKNMWTSKRNPEHVYVPFDYEHMIGPWTTITKAEHTRRLRAWEAFKKRNGDDLGALQAYVEGRAQ